MDVLKVQLEACEVGIFFQMTKQQIHLTIVLGILKYVN